MENNINTKGTSNGVKLQTKQGFTLIELLVVIAIIGMLSSVVLASLNSARAKSRDARRLADMKQLQIAFELYYDEHNSSYPPTPTGSQVSNFGTSLNDYIAALPTDPKYTGGAGYLYSIGGPGYTLLVNLEGDGSGWCGFHMSGSTAYVGVSYPECTN